MIMYVLIVKSHESELNTRELPGFHTIFGWPEA